MSYTIAVGDIIKATAVCQQDEQVSQTSMHYVCLSVTGASITQQEFVDAWDAVVAPLVIAVLASDALYYGSMAQKIWPLPVIYRDITLVSQANGGVASDALPRQTSGLVHYHGFKAGRANRGRIYLPFPATGSNTPTGHPSAGYGVDAVAVGSGMLSFGVIIGALGQAGFGPIIYHRKTHTYDAITSSASSPARWATTRRRGDFGRPNLPPF